MGGRSILGCDLGIGINRSNDNLIKKNLIFDSDFAGIYIYISNSNKVFNNEIDDCYRGVYLRDSEYNRLMRNGITDSTHMGIFAWNSDFSDVTDNAVAGTLGVDGIRIEDSSNCEITNNEITDSQFDAISLLSAHNNQILRNTINSVGSTGISVHESTNNLVKLNEITNCYKGISTGFTDEIVAANNIFQDNYIYASDGGFDILWENGDSIVGNTIIVTVAFRSGIYVEGSNNHLIQDNSIFVNGFASIGIWLLEASGNEIIGNYIHGDDSGIGIYAFFEAILNAIIGNEIAGSFVYNLYDDGFLNIWENNTYEGEIIYP